MGKPSTPDINVPDPREIMRAEAQYNRVNTQNPFGSVTWNGNTQVTNLSPEMQALQSRMFDLAGQDSQRIEPPEFLNDIAGGMMSNIGQRYGVGGKPGVSQQQPEPRPQLTGQSPQIPSSPDFMAQAQQLREMLAAQRNQRMQ